MNRRSFLMASVAIGATQIPTLQRTGIISMGRRSAATPSVFPQSVGSGDPGPNSIVLWTRVSPDAALRAAISSTVSWQIARTDAFADSDIVLQGTQTLSADADFTAKVIISDPALQPWTIYYYRFGFEGVLSNTGRFKTLPPAGMSLPLLRLGYISCQDFSSGYFTALAAMADEPLDFIVHLGDYIYEIVAQTGVVRAVPPLPSGGSAAASLADYRHLYRTYRSDVDLQRLHENFAFLQIWDDHEFANDSYQDFHPDDTPTPGVPTPGLRQAANQAWSEYSATSVPLDLQQDPLHSIQIYRSFQFGTLADLVMTDQRLYRDAPPCGLEEENRYVTAGCMEMNSTSRTMLGSTQKSWFIDRMLSSGANWKIWGNELMNMALKAVSGTRDIYVGLDSWDGFPAERSTILHSLSSVRNLVAISGDIHSFAAGYMKPSYDSIRQPRLGIEFVGGSVTSANFADMFANTELRSTSAPIPPKLLKQAFPGGLVSLIVGIMNPELEFFNSDTHGYVVLEIRPESFTCMMKTVSTVKQPDATVANLASFVVPFGQRRIIRA